MLNKKEIADALDILESLYPNVDRSFLNFTSPFELLIATILSAQCTDVRVNKVTGEMFKKYNTPEQFSNLSITKIEEMIKTCGLYKNKAKNIKNTSIALVRDFDSQVPNTMDELTSLPGVGRKTANVVMSNAFGIPAIAVDTHVFRVSNRIGFASAEDVLKTEMQLRKNLPEKLWSKVHHQLITHGRRLCKSRMPLCNECMMNRLCQYYKEKE